MKVTNYQGATIDPYSKGLGMVPGTSIQLTDAARLEWNLLNEDVSLPAAVLYADRVEHNLKWMQAFVAEYGVKLAPHGKTTMAPQLFRRQLETGAWGITLATAHQVRSAYHGGVSRILMANQLVGRRNMMMIAELLSDPDFEFFCLVDSVEGVEQLGQFFTSVRKPLQVLLELGVPGGRTGVRDEAQRNAVLEAIARYPDVLKLAGVELYEGVLKEEHEVREFLQSAVAVTRALVEEGRFARTPAVLSGAGSAWYDVVAEEFVKASETGKVEVVLRPGCYLTHDVGVYRKAQTDIFARNPVAKKMGEGLLPALQLWAYVQSIPEPDRAIIGLGKRDSAFDAGMPEPSRHYRPGTEAPRDIAASEGWEIFGLMDQHAYLRIPAGADLKVGDMIAFDISHPCLTFDKWRQVLVVDPSYRVTEVIETFF
ncbi:D-threonine aldolase [Paraburkholderia domus]|uniref:D-threonine aldolase n=1 Tax=Paraburkholderia domus TaxID=2793075 RepID=A0A9N8ML72_9BURK|nr:amino acid deaminase [Paraburkholderia domus]MBK5048114.1 amino acid deaminase [Burkholderia sp. R-70006]MBK5063074.1 amino acid deaminase [Burkholderia sp. R-70199]MBK5084382.1 amino acid deaminase [Burkholderia sp. R-69927]MBK5122935.1 amino acid deaminase [Burkholderia sp. R-69980]MBK5163423.1 amino acid deaminase [Burkholderia sp. R-70211]MBK5180143.1 amino acid deaminase [Burkholderia sp. R-69749]MCI0149480.1 alanine racemase [Paraburkholderia sediminicola]